MAWRAAKSLITLRDQINASYPNRSKVSDGLVGDTSHGARKSDHNPNAQEVVCAIDITHDLDKKSDDFDAWRFAETLRLNRDRRIGYVISNGRIFAGEGGTQPWTWRPYTGANKHAHHTHVSVKQDAKLYDDAAAWKLDTPGFIVIGNPPVVPPPPGITVDLRQRMAKTIVDFEAKRNTADLLAIHRPADGSSEVAGINDQHHSKEAGALLALLAAGKYAEAEKAAQDFVLSNTKVATGWTTDPGVEFYLRDCVFNRGPKGGARILQRAVGVPDDGEVGQITRAAIGHLAPADLLTKLRAARESYERDVLGYRASLWAGLVVRWDKALVAARKFQEEARQPVGGAITKNTTIGTTVATTVATAAGVAKKPEAEGGGFDFGLLIPIAVVGFSIAAVGWFIWPKAETTS